jgi:MYXO-CTERM domain-containing protein
MTHRLTLAGTAIAALALLAPGEASACGGFFCGGVPVDQSKERIVFGIDEEAGTVEVHVQIFFQGDAPEFAWVVPVPTVPEVGLSTDALFQQLDWQTRPYFGLQYEERGSCVYDGGGWWYPPMAEDGDAAAGGGAPGSNDGGIVVEAQGQTGPYDWTVVNAKTQDALVAWLKDPDGDPGTDDAFQLPAALTGKLASYVHDEGRFIAFRLQNDADAGDIAPIRMTYAGDAATVPLVLTSVAATPDMRVQPFVFAEHRAVPSNYLHVRVNEAKINWFTSGANYDEVVTLAADEAGGQAFATDFYGETAPFRGQLWAEGRFDLDRLRGTSDPAQFVQELLDQGFPRNTQMQGLLREYVPMPEAAKDAGVDEASFYNCLECYRQYLGAVDFDPVAFTAALDEQVVQPLHDAEQLYVRHGRLTRMTSSVSPEEMTLDPIFVLNADMTDPVSNQHTAKLVIDCGDDGSYSASPRWIELADGTTLQVPPDQWFQDHGTSYADWGGDIDQPAAALIERTGASGQPVPVQDRSSEIREGIRDYNDWVDGLIGNGPGPTTSGVDAGCGCDTRGAAGASLPALLGLVALARRRRR